MCWQAIEITDTHKTLMFEDKSTKDIICEYCIAKDNDTLNKICINCIYKKEEE